MSKMVVLSRKIAKSDRLAGETRVTEMAISSKKAQRVTMRERYIFLLYVGNEISILFSSSLNYFDPLNSKELSKCGIRCEEGARV